MVLTELQYPHIMSQYLKEIPPIFYSNETGAPIQRCLVCDSYLLDGAEYIIEKAVVNYPTVGTRDLVWEFALCMDCMEEITSEYSEESQQKMSQYFIENMNMGHLRELKEAENFDVHEWISKCIVKGKAQSDCSQYQLCGHFVGELCVFDHTPFLVSDEAMDEVVQLISNKTLGSMNDFRDRFFPPPEDLSPLLRDKEFILI